VTKFSVRRLYGFIVWRGTGNFGYCDFSFMPHFLFVNQDNKASKSFEQELSLTRPGS
jgi:hypothetical protein